MPGSYDEKPLFASEMDGWKCLTCCLNHAFPKTEGFVPKSQHQFILNSLSVKITLSQQIVKITLIFPVIPYNPKMERDLTM